MVLTKHFCFVLAVYLLCGAIKDILPTQIAATTFTFYQAGKISSECVGHMVISQRLFKLCSSIVPSSSFIWLVVNEITRHLDKNIEHYV